MNRETKTLLLVDSSAASLFYWGMLLKRLDYTVLPMRNGEAALRAMEGAAPAVVITERALTGMSGEDLVRKMQADPLLRAVPVVLLTAEESGALKDECRRLGCAAWFPKTVEPELLYRTLQALSEATPRRNIRLNTSLKVIVGDGSTMGGTERTEFAAAISEGGLYVRTRYPQPQHAITPVRVFLENGEVRATALVLYSYTRDEGPYKEAGMGMKFTEISDHDRGLIRKFIKEQLIRDIAR